MFGRLQSGRIDANLAQAPRLRLSHALVQRVYTAARTRNASEVGVTGGWQTCALDCPFCRSNVVPSPGTSIIVGSSKNPLSVGCPCGVMEMGFTRPCPSSGFTCPGVGLCSALGCSC